MTRERRLIDECRTALKIAHGSLLGINDVIPLPRAVQTAADLQAVVDKIDAYYRSAQETFAGQPGFPPESPEQERSMRRDRYPPRFEAETPAARPCPVCDTTGGHAWNCSLNQV